MKMRSIIPVMIGVISISGCGQYDVLDKIADKTAVEQSTEETTEEDQDTEAESVETEEVQTETTQTESRPSYTPTDYVDTSDCDITDVNVAKCEVTDDEATEAIRSLMQEKEVYSDTDTAGEDDIVNIDYTATVKGEDEPYVDATDLDIDVRNYIFPDYINDMFIGSKAGDTIDTEYTFPDDHDDEVYRGKAFAYHITVNKVKGMELTDDVAYELSSGAVVTATDYMAYAKAMLLVQKQEAALDDALDGLLEQCKVTGYPEDVITYDVQEAVIEAYEAASVTDATIDNFESTVLPDLGYDNMDDYLNAMVSEVKEDLAVEMKTLALAVKYDIDAADVSTAREGLKEKLNG